MKWMVYAWLGLPKEKEKDDQKYALPTNKLQPIWD